jgi:hypothetical protein
MKKQELVEKLLAEGIAGHRGADRCFIDFEELANVQYYEIFAKDLAETFVYLKEQHSNKLKLMFNMRWASGLARLIKNQLGLSDCAEYVGKEIKNFHPGTNYVFCGHCFHKGSSLLDANYQLQEFGSQIVQGLFFFDTQELQARGRKFPVEIYATLTNADFLRL